MKFKPGEVTSVLWCGDIVSRKCVFLQNLRQGRMLFYDETFKCFRLVFPEWDDEEKDYILNGCECSDSPSAFLQTSKKGQEKPKPKGKWVSDDSYSQWFDPDG
jgi:hypothetical protein